MTAAQVVFNSNHSFLLDYFLLWYCNLRKDKNKTTIIEMRDTDNIL